MRGATEEGVKYPVNEYFLTLQGEAFFTGTPALFVRFQGCPVGCGWCDTKYTWPSPDDSPPAVRDHRHVGSKNESDGRFAWMTSADVLNLLPEGVRHVVVTGGEPALYSLNDLTAVLVNAGVRPQVETSGTHELFCHRETWVTCSPKIEMPGGFAVRRDVLQRANEIKFPVGKERDVQLLLDRVLPHVTPGCLVWLQPLSMSKRATTICYEAASRNGWRVSVQTHKFIGFR